MSNNPCLNCEYDDEPCYECWIHGLSDKEFKELKENDVKRED